jgi:hypothetical protein
VVEEPTQTDAKVKGAHRDTIHAVNVPAGCSSPAADIRM